jgi:hypothetical protein
MGPGWFEVIAVGRILSGGSQIAGMSNPFFQSPRFTSSPGFMVLTGVEVNRSIIA